MGSIATLCHADVLICFWRSYMEGTLTNNFFHMLYDSYLKVEMKVKSDKYLTPGEMMI